MIADDATGALEAGAILAGIGIDVVVELEARSGAMAPACVLLVPTRHDSPLMARSRVGAALSAAAASYPMRKLPPLYLKTDSTLRGPIGACLGALLCALPDRPLVYIPAYPAMGRIVREGVLLVDGVPVAQTVFASDAGNPVRSSIVADVLAPGLVHPIDVLQTASDLREKLASPNSEVLICNAETEDDVAALIAECRKAKPAPLVAGPAGGIAAWAGGGTPEPLRRAWIEEVDEWLVVCGSRHPLARAQAKHARQLGLTVLATPETRVEDIDSEMETLAEQAAAAAKGGLVIFGGDTALAVWRAMGVRRLTPLGELMPGVAVSHAGGCTFITKAGGFPAPGMLEELLVGEEG